MLEADRLICGDIRMPRMILECRESYFGVAEVAAVTAIGETRGELSQVALANRVTALRAIGLRVECPVIDQDEFHLPPPAEWLHTNLFDLNRGKVACRRNSLDAVCGDDAENENRDDLKRRAVCPCPRKTAPANIRHPGHDAGRRVVFRGVDLLGGALRIAVKESDELLDLLLSVADRAARDLDVLGMRWKTRRQQQRQDNQERA